MAGDEELEALRRERQLTWSTLKSTLDLHARGGLSIDEMRGHYSFHYEQLNKLDAQIAHHLQDSGMAQKLELLARLQGESSVVDVTPMGSNEPVFVDTYRNPYELPPLKGYLAQGTEVVDDGMHERYHVGKAEVTRTVNVHNFVEPIAPSGMPPYWRYDIDPTSSFVYTGKPQPTKEQVYRNTVLELEEKIKTYHWASKTYSDDNPLQQVRAKGIMQLDERYKELCDELGYTYLKWKCTDGRNGEAVVSYETPPREIVDELFTEVTGLNPEDTYDGWREAFISTGLMSALEHMKEHVR